MSERQSIGSCFIFYKRAPGTSQGTTFSVHVDQQPIYQFQADGYCSESQMKNQIQSG